MEFEQQSIFDSPALPIQYTTLDNDGKVYCKLDWITCMFFDCSMNTVLSWLKLDDLVSDFLLQFYQRCQGYDHRFEFSCNGIMLDCSAFDFYGQQVDVCIFDKVVPKLRLELSGSGLDFLRSRGVDIDNFVRQPINLPEGAQYHFTRCDFAYDFINYCPEFMDQLLDYIYHNQLPSGRVPIYRMTSGVSCRVVTGGQKIVYLGSNQSDRMLRIYDKRLEQIDKLSWVYKKPNPYGDPDSWFRIEWQCRNKFANNMLVGVDDQGRMHDFKTILKLIFLKYAFAEGLSGDRHRNHVKPVDFWQNLFDWEHLEQRIIQNAKYVECKDPQEDFVQRFRVTNLRSLMYYLSLVGLDGMRADCNKYIQSLYQDDLVSQRRYMHFLNKCNYLQLQITSDSLGLYNNCGRLGFKI